MTTAEFISVGVINATYTPLGDTKLSRALQLVLEGRAVIEEFIKDRFIRSVSGVRLPFPKVIRMLEQIHVPFTFGPQTFSKHGVLVRDNFKCGYCLGPADTHDHIHPRSRGGQDTWKNAIAACLPCNSKKADRTPGEAGMPLLFQPTVPLQVYFNSGKKPNQRKR